MTYQTALTALAALNVPGVAHNFGLASAPDSLYRPQLPALLVLPGSPQDRRLFQERGEGFLDIAFSSGPRIFLFTATHLLLAAPVESGSGQRAHLPRLVGLIDAYTTALADDVLLGGALYEPARVRVETGLFAHGGVTYHGCAFRHTWPIEIAAG